MAQTLIVIFLLLMMFRKNVFEKIFIVILGLGVHSVGFILLISWFFIDLFFEKKAFFCVLPTTFSIKELLSNQNIFAKTTLGSSKALELNLVNSYITYSHVLNLFSRVFFLPLWFFSFQGLLKEKNRKYFFLLVFVFLAGFFSDQVNPLRILGIVIFPLGIGLIENYKTMGFGSKKVIWFFLGSGIVLNVYSWIILKNYNYCSMI